MVIFSNNMGESIENAITITGAENSMEGVRAEYRYLELKFGKRNQDWESGR